MKLTEIFIKKYLSFCLGHVAFFHETQMATSRIRHLLSISHCMGLISFQTLPGGRDPPPLGATSQLFVLKRLSFKGPSGNQDHDDRQAAIREMDLLGGRLFLPLGATPLFIKKIRSVYRPANTSIAHSQLFFFASAIFFSRNFRK